MQRSLICFSLLATLWPLCACSYSATVTGSVEISAGSGHSRSPTSNLSDIVVWLQPTAGTVAPPSPPEHVRLLQKNKMFHPHVLAIRVGTTVDFPNADPIFHNAFSNYDGQLFDVGLYPPGTTRSVRFGRPGVVRVFCNIHPSMSAVILALETPYFAHVENHGQYHITDVPPGVYELRVFDERATNSQERPPIIEVASSGSQTVAPLIRLDEAGYVQPPHKNKFGLDYPSETTDSYSGGPPQ